MALKIIILFLLNTSTWSATIYDAVWRESNTPQDEIYPVVRLSDTNTPNVAAEALKTSLEEGGSESEAIKVYIPVRSTVSTGLLANSLGNIDYFTRNVLPSVTSSVSGAGEVHFRLQINLENISPQYLHVAAESNSGYTIIQNARRLDSNNGNLPIIISFDELCPVYDCDLFVTSTRPPNQTREYHLLFFVSETPYSEGQEIAQADVETKLFYQLFLSNKIDGQNEINLQSLYKGDGQLHPTFDGFSLLSPHYDSLYAYVVEDSSMPCPLTADPQPVLYRNRTPTDGRLQTLDSLSTGGDANVKNLTNGHCYAIRLLYVDKFGFASRMSQSLVESPQEILSLLQKDQCYLLTAGFGRRHFVIDFFRNFRDRVLLSFSLGKALVSVYYATAPAYAPLILKSPMLAYSVRGVAYLLYGILRYFPYLLGLGLVGLFFFYLRRGHGGA